MLGESWPPRKGWIDRAIGREISDEQAAKFIEFSKNRPSKSERRKIKSGLFHYHNLFAERRTKKKKQSEKLISEVASDSFLTSYEWRRVRMQVLKRDGARCVCCGASPKDGVRMHVDHIKPRRIFPNLALDLNNLQVLCEVCNHGKGNWDMTDWRSPETELDRDADNHLRSI